MTVTWWTLAAQIHSSYGGFIAIAILILQLAVILSVLAGDGSAQHKILWSLVILLLPLVGLILYAVFGRSSKDRPLLE